MPDSKDLIRRRREMFNSYLKTVLRNHARNLERDDRRREKYEILVEDPSYYLHPSIQSVTEAEIVDTFVIMCLDMPCAITDETLFDALLSLTIKQRTVVLCSIWLNMADAEIAELFGTTARTIYNWRQKALERIKLLYKSGDAG